MRCSLPVAICCNMSVAMCFRCPLHCVVRCALQYVVRYMLQCVVRCGLQFVVRCPLLWDVRCKVLLGVRFNLLLAVRCNVSLAVRCNVSLGVRCNVLCLFGKTEQQHENRAAKSILVFCIHFRIKTLEKVMNPFISYSQLKMKQLVKLGSLAVRGGQSRLMTTLNSKPREDTPLSSPRIHL